MDIEYFCEWGSGIVLDISFNGDKYTCIITLKNMANKYYL